MAIYHLHVGIVSRSSGRSSVAAAAYRAAEKLRSAVNSAAYRSGESLQDKQHDVVHDYRRKHGVVHTEIMLPENAPQEYHDRATLWNAVEQAEKRKDAQTARDIDIALPVELNRQEQIMLMRKYVKENFVDKGMCADFAIHDKKDGNPHAHILLATREVTEKGFSQKSREWNGKGNLKLWRENWAVACNEQLQAKGCSERIDHRTLEAQGIDREPTKHIGIAAKHMERRGMKHDRAKQNREIARRNKSKQLQNTAQHMHELKESYITLDKEMRSLRGAIANARRETNFFLQEKLQDTLTRLTEEQKARHFEYQQQKLFADVRPDRQNIYDCMAELEKESRPHEQSVQDNLVRAHCQRMLDIIAWQDFQEIIKRAPPEKAQALIEQRERERARERMRSFQRGR